MSQTLKLARVPVCRYQGIGFLNPGDNIDILPRKNVRGQSRIVGNIRAYDVPLSPPSSGMAFAQILMGIDGITFPYVVDVPLDTTKSAWQYPVCVAIRYPYAKCYLQNGATPSLVDVFLELVPDSDDAGLSGSVPAPTPIIVTPVPAELIRSVSTVDFAAASIQGESQDADFGVLSKNTGRIEVVTLIAAENLDYRVVFWKSATRGGGSIDASTYLGSVMLPAASADTFVNDETAFFHYAQTDLEIDYEDSDGGSQLHASLVPLSGPKSAQPAGGIVLQVAYRPD